MSMHDEIREYIEGQFRGIPETDQTAEMREEILRNTIDRFDELCAEGVSEYEAYYKAIHSVGDVKEMFSSSAGAADTPDYSAYADEIREYKRSRAVTLSAAIVLYILCIVPPIIFTGTSMQDTLGPILMFVMIAIATALLIYRAKTADGQLEDIMRYGGVSDESGDYGAEDTRGDRKAQRRAEHRRNKDNKKRWNSHALRTLKGTIESLNVAAYLVVSFFTGAWHITWLMFVISWAVGNVIKACDDLIASGKDGNF